VRVVGDQNPKVAFGLVTFPVSLGCTTAWGCPNVPLTPNAADRVDEWFNQSGPAGGATPLIASMEWVVEHVEHPSFHLPTLVR